MPRFLKYYLSNFEECMSGFCLGTMILSLLIQAVVRAVAGTAVAWAEELSRFCFIWAVFFAMALASKKYEHVCITVQFIKLPQRIRFCIRILRDAVWIFFNVFIAYVSITIIVETMEFPEISQTLGFPKFYVEAVIPVSFILSSVRILEDYWKHYRSGTLKDMTI